MVKIRCGITGQTGSIGRVLLKNGSFLKFESLKGDITKRKDVEKSSKTACSGMVNRWFARLANRDSVTPL